MNDEKIVVAVNVPRLVEIDGLKHHDAAVSVDLSEKSPEWFAWAVAFAMRQSCGDADAGKADLPDSERRALVRAKFDKIAAGEIPSGGGGGGGKPRTAEREAELAVLKILFEGQGKKPGVAEKAATAKSAWFDVGLLTLSRKHNRTDVPRGDVEVFLAKNEEYFNGLIAAKVEEIREERAKAATVLDGIVY